MIFVRLTHFPIRPEWELVRSVSESERNACESLLIVFPPLLECEKTGLKSYKSETQVGRWIPNNLVVCFRLPIAPRFAHHNSPPNLTHLTPCHLTNNYLLQNYVDLLFVIHNNKVYIRYPYDRSRHCTGHNWAAIMTISVVWIVDGCP